MEAVLAEGDRISVWVTATRHELGLRAISARLAARSGESALAKRAKPRRGIRAELCFPVFSA